MIQILNDDQIEKVTKEIRQILNIPDEMDSFSLHFSRSGDWLFENHGDPETRGEILVSQQGDPFVQELITVNCQRSGKIACYHCGGCELGRDSIRV